MGYSPNVESVMPMKMTEHTWSVYENDHEAPACLTHTGA